jgi:2-dehydropantoate 2-reductase
VLLVDIQHEHVSACRKTGLSIEGPVENFVQTVPAVTPDELTGRYSCVVLAVKAHHTESAARQIAPHLTDDGYVVSAQNGLNEITLGRILGDERTMGAFVNFGADWHGPGRVLFGNRGAVVVGETDGSIRARTREMFALFQIFEPEAVLTDDIWSYLWGKLGYGAMLFGTALTNDSMADNFADPARAKIWIALGREVMAVARARGVAPRGFNGFEPDAFMPGADVTAARRSVAALADFNRHTAKTHSGIWRDLAIRKRTTEVDPQVGIVAELGDEAGVDTPVLRRLVELVHDVEAGRRSMSKETLGELAKLC